MFYISIVVTISRPEYIDLMIKNLSSLFIPKGVICELIIGIDNRKISAFDIERKVYALEFAQSMRNISVFNTGLPVPRVNDMTKRRNRITALRELTKGYIGGSNFVFSFEDDTVVPSRALENLLDSWMTCENPGFIEGVQAGRWGYQYIGAWRVDDFDNPTIYQSVVFEEPCQKIDGGGFYCYLTTTALYKQVEYRWQEPVGPDLCYGLALRKMGYNNYIIWDILCDHGTKDGFLHPLPYCQMKLSVVNDRWKTAINESVVCKLPS